MISAKKLIKMTRKWQKLAAIGRLRITLPRATDGGDAAADCSPSPRVNRGHFAVYTSDQRRFVIPLAYLKNEIFRELLRRAEEEYGLPVDGPITLPCDALFMEYIVSLIRRRAAKDMENALLLSITSGCCLLSSYIQQGHFNQQFLVFSF